MRDVLTALESIEIYLFGLQLCPGPGWRSLRYPKSPNQLEIETLFPISYPIDTFVVCPQFLNRVCAPAWERMLYLLCTHFFLHCGAHIGPAHT